ncbi:hypothetical protein TRIP_D250007 [uncultured Paludibacter sp.]|nr:hypothetical protein TRIP_D250007 [uncultured Paludibacter sp.]
MKDNDKILIKYYVDINSFNVAKDNFYRDCSLRTVIPNEVLSEMDRIQSSKQSRDSFAVLCKKLAEIMNICANEANLKEEAEIFYNIDKEIVPKVGFHSDQSGIDITIGLFRDFYITTKICFPDNLNSMPDEFWQMLFKLSNYGKFEFREEHKPSAEIRKKHPQLFNKRGSIYKLTRNYFLSQTEYGYCNSLGHISVQWGNGTKFDDLINNYCETFKIMYNLNHMLWREENKKNKKKITNP